MSLKSALRPDSATMVGLLTAAGVYLIYNQAVPNLTDLRLASPNNAAVESERKKAAWESAALVGIVFLVSRDLNSYLISGTALVGLDLMTKHADSVNPATNKTDTSANGSAILGDQDTYSQTDTADDGSQDYTTY